MSNTIKSLLSISSEIPKYIFMSFLFSIGKMVAFYATFSESHLLTRGHSSLTLQLHNGLLKPGLSTHEFSINFFIMVANDFVLIISARIPDFNVFFLFKIFFNVLFPLKCLSISLIKYLPILIVDNLHKSGMNPIRFLFLCFSFYFYGCYHWYSYH